VKAEKGRFLPFLSIFVPETPLKSDKSAQTPQSGAFNVLFGGAHGDQCWAQNTIRDGIPPL
jgi:hypothetical protein